MQGHESIGSERAQAVAMNRPVPGGTNGLAYPLQHKTSQQPRDLDMRRSGTGVCLMVVRTPDHGLKEHYYM